jgi:hypothetical protein
MADPHVISALREKRAKVAGCIARLERQLDQHRADLSHIDGVLRLFEPDRDPEAIKPIYWQDIWGTHRSSGFIYGIPGPKALPNGGVPIPAPAVYFEEREERDDKFFLRAHGMAP